MLTRQLIHYNYSNNTITYCVTAGLDSDGAMLLTMLHCASHDTPLLVWACTYAKEAEAMPAVEVANMLQLIHSTHPWKVSFDST